MHYYHIQVLSFVVIGLFFVCSAILLTPLAETGKQQYAASHTLWGLSLSLSTAAQLVSIAPPRRGAWFFRFCLLFFIGLLFTCICRESCCWQIRDWQFSHCLVLRRFASPPLRPLCVRACAGEGSCPQCEQEQCLALRQMLWLVVLIQAWWMLANGIGAAGGA